MISPKPLLTQVNPDGKRFVNGIPADRIHEEYRVPQPHWPDFDPTYEKRVEEDLTALRNHPLVLGVDVCRVGITVASHEDTRVIADIYVQEGTIAQVASDLRELLQQGAALGAVASPIEQTLLVLAT